MPRINELRARYASCTTDELLDLASRPWELISEAQIALQEELVERDANRKTSGPTLPSAADVALTAAPPASDYDTLPTAQATRPFSEYQPAATIDARPILARNTSNIWERTEYVRSKLHACIEDECRKRGIEALVLKSDPYVHPAWVKFETWVPAFHGLSRLRAELRQLSSSANRNLTRRSSMSITITALPYHRFEMIYKVEWVWQGVSGEVDQIHTLSEHTIRASVASLVAECEQTWLENQSAALAANFRRSQLRQKRSLKFWRPKNEIQALGVDLLLILGNVLLLVAVGAWVAAWSGFVEGTGVATFGGIAAFAAAIFVFRRVTTCPRLVRTSGKPLSEPRILRYLDSWQTVVFGAGGDSGAVKASLMSRLADGHQQRFACTVERIWHWGLEGKEEREQIVLQYGRALVYAQIYQYGADLYVGWNAQMNLGKWIEKKLASGVERETRVRVDLMTVESGSQTTTEYDLIDVNCLAEWTHAQITQVVKHYVKERKIDQELDFAIIRGVRKGIGDPEKRIGDPEKKHSWFQRTA